MVKKLFRISRWQQLSIAPSVGSVQMHRLVAGDEIKEKGHLASGAFRVTPWNLDCVLKAPGSHERFSAGLRPDQAHV